MRCVHCSTPIPDGSKFCLSCGADLSDPAAHDQTGLTDDGVSNMERKLRADTEGEFEIERELGRGGMAVVYLATDVHLRRKVAIKVLPPDLTFGKGTIERFRREAQTAAQLDHPNIIPVYRISTGGDLFWYAMKFIEGRSLDEILKDGMRFDLGGCIDILDQVASALDWAHRRQVVHRDVKPANIMIDPTGRVTMADFGIAKALSKTSLTASGSAIGTPNYMSPEQCMGGAITGAADQYALGVVTYQMLSGKLPFEADSAVELIQKHCFVPPPSLEEARPGLPKNVYTAVERALAKKSGERFPSVGEFVKALRDPSKASAGLSPRPSATPIPTDAPSPTAVPIDAASTTPIPVDEQSTTPIPAVTPDSIHEASTTPIPAATPGAIHEASTTPIPTTAPSATRSAPPHDDTQDGTPTEVIHQVGKHRRLGVAAAAMAALVVIAGAIGWLLVGSGGGGSTPPVAAQDDSGFGELDQERAIAVGVGAVADSEPPVAPGTREDLRAGPQTVAPPIDAPQAGGRPTETQQPPGEPSERLSVRGDTTPEDPPAARERRTEAAAAVAAADPGKPPADPKPPPAQERRTENERPVERTPPAPTGPGTIAWSQPAEYRGLGSPAVATDGRILVGSRALTRAGDRAAAPAVRGTAQSTPAVATSGTIYVGAGGELHAFTADGSPQWVSRDVRSPILGVAIAADQWIFVAAESGLHAIDASGQYRWGALTNLVSPPAIGPDGTIYVGARDSIQAFGPDSRKRWVRPVGSTSTMVSSPAVGADGTVYAFSDDGKVYAFTRTGEPRWTTAVGLARRASALSSPVVGSDGTVYVGTLDGYLHALDGSNGDSRWMRELGGSITATPVIGDDGTIYVGSSTGMLYAVSGRGEITWRLPVGPDPGSATIGPDGTLYVVTADGRVHAIRSGSGGLARAPWPKAGHDNANSGYVGRD